MTLDLEELERKAKAAQECRPGPWTPLIDSGGEGAWVHEIGNSGYDGQLPTPIVQHLCAANPSVILALIERVRAAEAAIPRCECGSTASVRGDPECDACGKDCWYCECPGGRRVK